MTSSPTVTDVAETPALWHRYRYRFVVVVGSTAIVLGVLAFAADLVQGIAGQGLNALTSSGCAWGLAALLVGRGASTRRRAAIGGAIMLVGATLLYYLLVLLVSRRWSGAYAVDPATGISSPSDVYGLRSIAITTVLWLIASAIAGPTLGLLGRTVRSDTASRAALAAGVGVGLLSSQGWYAVWRTPLWGLNFNDAYNAQFARGVAASEVATVVFPVAVLVWLCIADRLGRAWPILLLAAMVSTAAGAFIWLGIDQARNLI